jgi:hypothetical protein
MMSTDISMEERYEAILFSVWNMFLSPIQLLLAFLYFLLETVKSTNKEIKTEIKSILITGASSGIGKHLSLIYAKPGASLLRSAFP